MILVLIYVSALVLHIYKAHRKRLYRRLALLVEDGNPSLAELLLGGREIVATLWDAHAWLWHGYELWGLENLPTEVSCGWWTVVLQKVASELHPKVRNHGEGPY